MTLTVTDDDRRRRIAQRHGIVPGHRCADVVEATRAVTVLHATEPATVYLSLHARVDGVELADIDHALYGERSLVKQLAMRRTLFVFPRDLLPAAWGSATARVRQAEDRRLAMEVERHGIAENGPAWVAAARASAVDALAAAPDGLTGQALRAAVPQLAEPAVATAGTSWVASMLLTNLGLHLEIVRGHNTQHWRLSRPRWTTPERWLGTVPEPLSSEAGYAVLVERWLRSFGPGTEDDIVWWLGATKGAVRRALADVGAVQVRLDDAAPAWIAADDPLLDSRSEAASDPPPWAALLPVLDPTVMAWKGRGFYLGEHGPALFDRNGNAGTSAWWNGRIVGAWTQDDDGAVAVRPLEPLAADAQRALRAEAARLGAWLGGQRVGTVYPSPAMRAPESDLPYPVLRA